MADVFLAMVAGPAGSGFSKLEVVKRLRQNLAEDPDFIAMLMDEARISARLNHPNVVQTIEVGVVGDAYYLALEYLDGQPLHRLQRRAATNKTPVPDGVELLVVSDVLAGLHHAHELADYDGTPLNVVHRDVTPQNVFVTYNGHVKVVDFGIAKAAGRSCETRQGVVKGKLRYMAPEQAMGLALDRRADVFAAGLLLWEAVTGARFWEKKEELEIARALIAGQFNPSLRAVKADVPDDLERICKKALSHAPHERYATAESFRTDLDAYLSRLDTTSLRRQLAAFASSLFAKERAQLKEIVERAGRETAPLSVEQLAFSRSASMRGSGPASSIRPTVLDSEGLTSPTLAAPAAINEATERPVLMAAPRAQERRVSGWLIGVVGATVVTVLLAFGVNASNHGSAGATRTSQLRDKSPASIPDFVRPQEKRRGGGSNADPPVRIVTYYARASQARSAPRSPAPASAADGSAPASASPILVDRAELPARAPRNRAALDGDDPWSGINMKPNRLDTNDPWVPANSPPK